MSLWTQKYSPKNTSDIIGNKIAIRNQTMDR